MARIARTLKTPRAGIALLIASVAGVAGAVHLASADPLDPTKPVPSFTSAPDAPVRGEKVKFTSTSEPGLLGGPIATEEWDLDNDGSFDDGTGRKVDFTFNTMGVHTVALRVVDTNGASDVATGTVTVGNRPPSAGISASPSSPSTFQTITFTSSSTDEDGAIAAYAWDLDNDGNFDNGTGSEAQTSFSFAGSYTVRLLVTDNDGGTDVAATTVEVGNQPPLASFDYTPANPSTADEITLTSTASDVDGAISSYSWDLDGDGTYGDATDAQTKVLLSTPGNHTVRLRVTDNNGASATASQVIAVANRGPVASFVFSPATPSTGDEVTFTSTSTDPDGTIASRAWDLDNDGQFDDGTGATAKHTFATQGPHSVHLRVTDSSGASDTASHTVDVGNRGPQASFSFSPPSPQTGVQVTLTSTSTDADGAIASYSWDLDGNGAFGDAATPQANVTFGTPGNHTVRLQVTDSSGASDVAAVTIPVQNRAPAAAFGYLPSNPQSGETITFTSTSSDPDGSIASLAWDLDNDGLFDDGETGSVQTSFATGGGHIVKLRVTDDSGASDTATLTVQVANRPPVASFDFSPPTPTTGDEVTFTSTSTDPDGSIASRAWDLDDDGQFDDGASATVKKTFATQGPHSVHLRVTDSGGASDTVTRTVEVGNRGPTASFSFSPPAPLTGVQVTLTSTSTDPDGSIASYSWDLDGNGSFGDATTAQAQTSFATPGDHTVRLQVTDSSGASDVASVTITAANRAPTAAFEYSPATPQSGEVITFTSTSTDPDGSIASIAWDLDNDGLFDDGATPPVQTSFVTGGAHIAKLRVTDSNGASDNATLTVQVANRAPVAGFTSAPDSPKTGEQVTFTSTATDPDGSIAGLAWDLDNDGQFDDGSGASATRTFATAGTYTARLRATDDDGATNIATGVVVIANRPPAASFGFSPAVPKTGDDVTLTSTSTDPDGSIVSYSWDLNGDGTFGDSTSASPTTSFATPGSHTVQLQVTDNHDASNVATQSIAIANRPPVANFTVPATSPKTLEIVTFTSTATDPDGTIAAYAWDLDNDGQFDDGATAEIQHSFPIAGSHTIKLMVTDSNGATATASKSVTALNQAPTAAFTTSPDTPTTDGPVTFTSSSVDPENLPLTAAWDLDDNGSFESTGASVQKTFTAPGTYTFRLRVTDASGDSDVATGQVNVPNRQPTATVDHEPKNPDTGTAVKFTATSSDPENRVKSIAWSADGDDLFNDGNGQTFTRTYRKPGAYHVKFRIEDQDGGVATAEDAVAVGNRAPQADFVVLAQPPIAGVPFTIVSTATDPDTALDRWLWDLNGDEAYDDAEGSSVQHMFPAAGTYTVGLKVLDSEDVANVSRKSVVVQAPPVPATPQLAPTTPSLKLLSPFPVVRLAGSISRKGTRLRLFSIEAPPGARVVVTCKGRSCPFRLSARSASAQRDGKGNVRASTSLRIRQLEKRVLKKGVRITIFITKPGVVGKYVQFKFQKRRPPARVDRCLMPSAPKKPVECPS